MLRSARWSPLILSVFAGLVISGCGGSAKPEVSKALQDQEARERRLAQYEEQIQLGKSAFQAKRFVDAEEAFHKADLIQPNDELVLDWIAKTKSAKQEVIEADFKTVLQDGGNALQKGDFATAQAAFQRALQLKPSDPTASAQLKEAECRVNVQLGRQAMAERRYADAVKAFGQSARLKPDDREIQQLARQAEEANRALMQADYDKLVAAGRLRLAAREYQPALAAFDQAQRLMPGRADVAALRTEAEFSLHFEQGRQAFDGKRFADARAALEAALRLRPDDAAAAGLFQQAQQVLDNQMRADFDQAISAGKRALVAARYVEAIAALQQARRLMPNDQEAANLLKQAEQGKRRAEFDRFMSQGKQALATARYVEAIGSFKEAQRVIPDDREAARLLAEAEQGKRKAEYDQFLSEGRKALAAGRYVDAIGSFKEAQRVIPGDREAGRLLTDAEGRKRRADYDKALASGRAALSSKRVMAALAAFKEAKQLLPQESEAAQLLREAENAKRQYDTQMTAGRTALAGNKFDAAIDAFRAASVLVVDDPEAARLMRDAQNRKEHASQVSKGKLAMNAGRYDDAVAAFSAAVRLVPGGEAQTLLKQAEAKKKEEDKKNKKGK